MDGKIAYLALLPVPELIALGSGALERDGHVAEQHPSAVRVALAEFRIELTGRQLVHREREHIRRRIYAAELEIHGVYPLVVGEQDVDLTRHIDPLGFQRGGNGFFYGSRGLDGAEAGPVAGDVYLVFHHGFLLNL